MASARLTLDDAHDSIHTHDLVTVNHENKSHQLPLFGHFCCRLAVQPNCISQVRKKNLTIDLNLQKIKPFFRKSIQEIYLCMIEIRTSL